MRKQKYENVFNIYKKSFFFFKEYHVVIYIWILLFQAIKTKNTEEDKQKEHTVYLLRSYGKIILWISSNVKKKRHNPPKILNFL